MKTDKDKVLKYARCVHFITQTMYQDNYNAWEFMLKSKENFIKYLKVRRVCSKIGTNFKSKVFKLAIDHVFELLRS